MPGAFISSILLLHAVLLVSALTNIKSHHQTSENVAVAADGRGEKLLLRKQRNILRSRKWCDWQPPSACSVSCEGRGRRSRIRVCTCYSYNPIMKFKNFITNSKCTETLIQKQWFECNTRNITCPQSGGSSLTRQHKVYWVLGGVVIALVSSCMLAWCFLGWLQDRSYKQQRQTSRREERARRESRSVDGSRRGRRRRGEEDLGSPQCPIAGSTAAATINMATASTTKPATPPPPAYEEVMFIAAADTSPQHQHMEMEPPPPSYLEALHAQMTVTTATRMTGPRPPVDAV